MCGIMGYYSFNESRPDKENLENMFMLLHSRGHDASGYAFIRENTLIVQKAPVPSSELIKTMQWQELELPKVMIFHTRLKTKGDQQNNYNNHPLFTKQGICIVHNGMIYNDDDILKKEQRDGEVDSEAVLNILAKKRKDNIKKLFQKLLGSFAVAMINRNEPDKLTLIKKDNPLEIYYNSKDDILYFCSERQIMQESLNIRNTLKRGFTLGENEFHHYTLEDNYCLIINSEGVESYKAYTPRRDNYFGYRDPREDEYFEVECPWCLRKTRFNENYNVNHCRSCGNAISWEDL